MVCLLVIVLFVVMVLFVIIVFSSGYRIFICIGIISVHGILSGFGISISLGIF